MAGNAVGYSKRQDSRIARAVTAFEDGVQLPREPRLPAVNHPQQIFVELDELLEHNTTDETDAGSAAKALYRIIDVEGAWKTTADEVEGKVKAIRGEMIYGKGSILVCEWIEEKGYCVVDGDFVLEGILDADLDEATDILTGEKTAEMSVYTIDGTTGNLKDSALKRTVTNRDTELSANSGDYVICERINNEWRPIFIEEAETEKHIIEGVLDATMAVATNVLTGATTVAMSMYIPDGTTGNLKDSTLTRTLTNRSLQATADSGTYVIAHRINDEWRPIWLDCNTTTC